MGRDDEKEEAKSQEERLRELARWIQAQPWNAPGKDKTWVFVAEASWSRLRAAFERVED